jgi:DNA-binding protein
MVDENFIFIGKKPLMSYVLAASRQINDGDGTIVIKARGKSISRAVDVAEILRNQFVTTASVDDIDISTERLTSDEGRESNVSSIEIFMSVPEDDGTPEVDPKPERTQPPEEVEAPEVDTSPEVESTPEEEPIEEDTGSDFFGEFKDQS